MNWLKRFGDDLLAAIEAQTKDLELSERLRHMGVTREWAEDIAVRAAQLGVRDADQLDRIVREYCKRQDGSLF